MPFCTSRKSVGSSSTFTPKSAESLEHITFSTSEVERSEGCLKESNDPRYALWQETFYPQSNAVTRDGVLEVLLKRPTPPAQRTVKSNPMCGCVLTSEQCIQEMKEKEEKKKKIIEEKEEKRRERERKKKEKESAKASKKKGKGNM